MSAEATLILSRGVVANERAQQEEAHGDSTEKVKQHPVDVTYTLDWNAPYKHGGTQARSPAQAGCTEAGSSQAGSAPQHCPQAGSSPEARCAQARSAEACSSPEARRSPQAGSTQAGSTALDGPQAGSTAQAGRTEAGSTAQARPQAGGTPQAGPQAGSTALHGPQAGSTAQAGRTETGSTPQAGPQAGGTAQAGTPEYGPLRGPYQRPRDNESYTQHPSHGRVWFDRGRDSSRDAEQQGADRDEPHGNVGRHCRRRDHSRQRGDRRARKHTAAARHHRWTRPRGRREPLVRAPGDGKHRVGITARPYGHRGKASRARGLSRIRGRRGV
jgi:hypothetical protein